MCGIVALSLENKVRTEKEYGDIRTLLGSLIQSTSKRGEHATGIVTISKSGDAVLLKSNAKSAEFIESEQYNMLIPTIGARTKTILAHCRRTTKGSASIKQNNHPVLVHPFVGIHNGTIMNDDELVKEHKLSRDGSVDSEVIIRLLKHYNPKKITKESIKKTCEELEGGFACVTVNLHQPNILGLYKNRNPIIVFRVPELGLVGVVSEYLFISDALKAVGIKGTSDTFHMRGDRGLILDSNIPQKGIDYGDQAFLIDDANPVGKSFEGYYTAADRAEVQRRRKAGLGSEFGHNQGVNIDRNRRQHSLAPGKQLGDTTMESAKIKAQLHYAMSSEIFKTRLLKNGGHAMNRNDKDNLLDIFNAAYLMGRYTSGQELENVKTLEEEALISNMEVLLTERASFLQLPYDELSEKVKNRKSS